MKLNAEKRERLGTSASKQARRDNKVPTIIYGRDIETTPVLVDRKEFDDILRKLGRNAVFNVVLDGKEIRVLIKEISMSALKPEVYNVELNALTKGQKVTVEVAVVVHGADEIKEGVVTQPLTEIEIETEPGNIPTEITHDISELVIGDTVAVSDLVVPENVEVLTEPETTVVIVSAPRLEEEESATDDEVAEPEVIGEKEDSE